MTLAKSSNNRTLWSGLLLLSCFLFAAGVQAQDFCPQDPIAVCGLPGAEVCVDLPITGADAVLVDGGSWSDGKLCFTPTAFGENSVTVRGVFGTDTTTCSVTVVLNEGTKPTITCPEEPFDIFMCGPGLACIAAPMTKDAGRVFAQGAEVTGGNLCVNVDTSGTYYITLYAVNDCGADSCTVTVNVKVGTKPVIECPVVPEGGIPLERCGAGTVCFPFAITGADTVTVPHGGSYSGGQICFIADTTGHYNYTVYAQNECGVTQCELSFDVTINDVPVIACPQEAYSVNSCAGQVCVPLSIEHAESVEVPGATYENGQVCFTADTSGSYSFMLKATNECGFSECLITVLVTVTNKPVIACETSSDTLRICAPGQVCIALPITDAGKVEVDGATWAEGQLCFFAKASGTYTFNVHATNECGSADCEVTRSVELVAPIVMTCPDTALQLKFCRDLRAGCVEFVVENMDSVKAFLLDGGDSATAGWHNNLISLSAADTGLFHINVIAYGPCQTESCQVTVHAYYGTDIAITCPDTTLQLGLCNGVTTGTVGLIIGEHDSVLVSIADGPEGASVQWAKNLLSLTVADTGLYHVNVYAYSECGADTCVVAIHATSSNTPSIACPLSEQSVSVCSLPDSVTVSLGVTGADKVVVFSNDAQGTWENGTVTFVASEVKLYTFTVVASNQCGSDTCMFSVNVLQSAGAVIVCPEGDFNVSICDTGLVCVPLQITGATDVIVKGGSAQWADGQLCFHADSARRYGFLVMATSDCGSSQCGIGVNVSLGQSPQACFTPKPDSGVAPLTVTFVNCSITTGDTKYDWNFGDSTTSNDTAPIHVFKAAGCYDVTLTVTTSCGQSSASHTVCVTGGQIIIPTPEWINVYCASPLLDGISLQPGDVITAYDPDGVLCGMDIVRADGQFGFMPVYRDDIFSSGVDEGAEPGDVISFRVNDNPVFTGTAVIWTSNGDSYQLCDFLTHTPQTCRVLHLNEGWNLISWNVAWSGDIEAFIADYANCIDEVLGFDQGALTYDPNLTEYSTLWNVDYHFGYWFKMNCPVDIEVCGDPLDPNDGISVHSGWNLIAYWPESTLTVEDGFASMIDNVQVALGYNGAGLVYQPGQGGFNTLTDLHEFNGYWVRSDADVLFGYPGFTPSGTTSVARGGSAQAVTHNWISIYGKKLTLDGTPLASGAAIEARTANGVVCGSAVYNGSVLKFTPVYGADGTESAQYPKSGEMVQVFVNGQRTYPDITWSTSGDRVDVTARFSSSEQSVLPNEYKLAQNYPNPFNPTTKISFSLKQTEAIHLVVFNVLGQKIATVADGIFAAGEHVAEWNGRDDAGKPVTSGVYFYRLDTPSFSQTKKMVLTK